MTTSIASGYTAYHITTDHAALRREGLRHLERLASATWTDFNAHDPGITILEQLCYAITDLGYRISHPLPDLLSGSSAGDDPYASLHGPATLFTTEPVTLTDLRKLVLDVAGVRNAWIELADKAGPDIYHHDGTRELHLETGTPTAVAERDKTPIAIMGLYRVLIETSDLLDIDSDAVKRAVLQRLHAHRPLCEDFAEVRVLEPQPIRVKARVELAPGQDSEAVLLAIYQAMSGYLAPTARFATLSEMIARNLPTDEIFDGPRLDNGFLDRAALDAMERRTAVHTSDLIHAIMDVPGVRAVRDITVSSGGKDEPWSLDLDPAKAPRLDLQNTTITLTREGLAATVDPTRVVASYIARARSAAVARGLPASERDLVPPEGRHRDLAAYTSIQQQLPRCYGIGAAGLPGSAPATRRAQARQLEAYLLLFDQLLASCFSQLDHARTLLSFAGDSAPTYVAAPIDDPEIDLEAIIQSDPATHRATLDAIVRSTPRTPDDRGDRENRFLDHLLARYAESFSEYALVLGGALPPGEASTTAKLARDKRAFLQHYPRISAARNTGFDYTRPSGPDNASGLEDRLRLALGLHPEQGERLLVIEHILFRPIAEDRHQIAPDETRTVPLLAASPHPDPYSLQLSVVLPQTPARFTRPDFRRFVEHTIRAETPAHLTVYIHWLASADFTRVETTCDEWRGEMRAYWTDLLGL